MNRITQKIIGVFITVMLILLHGASAFAQQKAPNVILILADDLGWGATSVKMDPAIKQSASDFIQTPNIERLAESGVVFSQAYAPHPNCSPTRASILTGKSPAQLRFTDIIKRNTGPLYEGNHLLPPMHINQLPDEEITIAEWIKRHNPNYSAAHFGKWHIGDKGPSVHGFDVGGGPTGNREGTGNPPDDPKRIFSITEQGMGWMEKQHENGNPFYLQLSHYATHRGIESQPSTLQNVEERQPGERHKHERFAAMTEDLDEGVGMLLDKVKELGIENNTYIIFTSDNGTYPTNNPQNINGPLHGWKATLWEGGIRVPFIVDGPGIQQGQSDEPVVGYDIFATVSDWLNIDGLPRNVEGGSLARILDNSSEEATIDRPRDFLAFHFPHYQLQKGNHPVSAIIKDDFKLLKFYETGNLRLYDLDEDINESRNLAYRKPDLTRQLHEQLNRYLNEIDAALPVVNKNYDADKSLGKNNRDTKEQLMEEPYFVID
jgi:arylsulfatase A-like enzyme